MSCANVTLLSSPQGQKAQYLEPWASESVTAPNNSLDAWCTAVLDHTPLQLTRVQFVFTLGPKLMPVMEFVPWIALTLRHWLIGRKTPIYLPCSMEGLIRCTLLALPICSSTSTCLLSGLPLFSRHFHFACSFLLWDSVIFAYKNV